MAIQVLFGKIDHSILKRVHDASAPEGKVTLSPRYPETSLRDSTIATVETVLKGFNVGHHVGSLGS